MKYGQFKYYIEGDDKWNIPVSLVRYHRGNLDEAIEPWAQALGRLGEAATALLIASHKPDIPAIERCMDALAKELESAHRMVILRGLPDTQNKGTTT